MTLIVFIMVFFSDIGFAADITHTVGPETTSVLTLTSRTADAEADAAIRKRLAAQNAARASRVVVLQGGGACADAAWRPGQCGGSGWYDGADGRAPQW